MDLKEQQVPLNVKQQIENLKALNLIIDNEELAERFLNDVSYFRFIKAYSLGLKPKNGNYDDGVTFEQLMELYLFNANFRQLLFAQIEKIEVNLRCRVANYFSVTYGVLGYLDSQNFDPEIHYDSFLDDIQSEVDRNYRAPYIQNFRKNYVDGAIPFYALVEVFSFGTLSKYFKNMKSADKDMIASSYGVPYTYLESWVESIAYVRNLCAHYGRLYNAKLTKTPILYKEYRKQGIKNNRVFGVLCCLKHLLPNDRHWIEFVDQLKLLFEKYPHVKKETMGFGEAWKEILLR